MALPLDEPLLWGFVFLLVLVVELIVVANIKGQGGRGEKYERASQEAVLADGEALTDVLSRFVEDADGTRLGESISMDGELVIIKGRDPVVYHALPRASLQLDGESFKVVGEVDWPAAQAKGEAWRERQHRVVEYTDAELPEDERPAD